MIFAAWLAAYAVGPFALSVGLLCLIVVLPLDVSGPLDVVASTFRDPEGFCDRPVVRLFRQGCWLPTSGSGPAVGTAGAP